MAADYREVLGTAGTLRRGYTTGTTAQAAAAAALELLITGEVKSDVEITLPKSNKPFSEKEITIPLHSSGIQRDGSAGASVLKDSGDDRDDTNGMEIRAAAAWAEGSEITLIGGEGIGRVTGEGLPVKPGNPAINPVPRKMILQETDRILSAHGLSGRAVTITFSAPEGEKIAAGTWNSRVGVRGGISLIGTSGVVEPRSEKAFQATLGMVIRSAARRADRLTIASGYVGERFLTAEGFDEEDWVAVGDLIGFALKQAQKRGIRKIFLPLHIGKITKVAAGLFQTHCDYGDARMETLAACAGAAGATPVEIETLLAEPLAEKGAALLKQWKLDRTFTLVCERAKQRCRSYLEKECGASVDLIETAALDLKGKLLGWSGDYEGSEQLCLHFKKKDKDNCE